MIINCSSQDYAYNDVIYNSIGFNAFDTHKYGTKISTIRNSIVLIVPLELFIKFKAVIFAVRNVFFCRTACY